MPAAPYRMAVFRALQLGDMLAAVPALRALRAWKPEARLTMIGLPWALELFPRYECIDDFLEFPGHPLLPERNASDEALAGFFAQARARRFDLAAQLHGSGSITNAIVAQLGAATTAGFHPPSCSNPDPVHYLCWPQHGREAERLMSLPRHLGAPSAGCELDFPVLDGDRARLARLWSPAPERRTVIIHPGARLPSRRWPAERFALVAHAMREQDCEVVLTGSAAEADTLACFRAHAPDGIVDLSQRTDLGTLGALIDAAALLICNDTGVSHIASARGTPSVVVSCGADASRWAPLDGARHRVLAAQVACRPCSYERCPTMHECAQAVEVESVIVEAHRLLSQELPRAA
jgi:ADP-heptose:LPS heptosyltransferase